MLTQLCSSSSRVTTITSPLEKVSSRALSPLQSTTAFTRFCLPLACTRNGVNDKGKGGEGGSSTPTPIHIRCDPPNPSILGRGQQGCSPICCTPLCSPPPPQTTHWDTYRSEASGHGHGGHLAGRGVLGALGGGGFAHHTADAPVGAGALRAEGTLGTTSAPPSPIPCLPPTTTGSRVSPEVVMEKDLYGREGTDSHQQPPPLSPHPRTIPKKG